MGGWFGTGFTVIVASSKLVNCESLAVSRKTYVPAWLNATVVAAELGLPNVAVPGPLTLLQAIVSVPPTGRPSSLTVPFS